MDWKKRTLSLMLAVAMLISNCPVAAFAAENTEIPFVEETLETTAAAETEAAQEETIVFVEEATSPAEEMEEPVEETTISTEETSAQAEKTEPTVEETELTTEPVDDETIAEGEEPASTESFEMPVVEQDSEVGNGDILKSGTCGANLTWTFNTETKVLTISGRGDINYQKCPWAEYQFDITKVVLEEGVSSIPYSQFNSYSELETVEIPQSVDIIGNSAFMHCSSLKTVVLPEGVKSIGSFAFGNTILLN